MAMNIQPGEYPHGGMRNGQQPEYGGGMQMNMNNHNQGMGQGLGMNMGQPVYGGGQGFGSNSPNQGMMPGRSNSSGSASGLGVGSASGSGMSALSALMRGGQGSSPSTPMTIHREPQGYGNANGHNGSNGNNNMDEGMNNHYDPYPHGQPGSFPNQPHNSPTFPSNLSPYAQPFVLPSTGGYSYSQTGIPMSLGGMGMGSLLGGHHNFPGSIGMGMGMSISPGYGSHWPPPGGGAGGMSFTQMGSYLGNRGGHMMGSVGNDPNLQIGPGPAGSSVNSAMMMQHGGPGAAWGVGGERSRELEKRYVRDFTCCGLKLGGLHDLLEHYEECHVHLAPDLRKQSMSIDAGANPENLIIPQNPAINAISRTGTPSTSFPTASPFSSRPQPAPPSSSTAPSMTTKQSSPTESDAPGTPGMMDIEMTMDDDDPTGVGIVGASGAGGNMPSILPPSSAQWTAFQQAQQPPPGGFPQCVEPSKLSYAIPGVGTQSGTASQPVSKPGTPVGGLNGVNLAFNGAGTGAIGKPPRLGGSTVLSPEQKAERAARKAAKKEARRIAKENGELSSDDGRDAEGFKKYRCPVPGCNKSYRQANGLKYHVQRSINSTHGHLVNVPLLPHPHHPDTKAHEKTAPV